MAKDKRRPKSVKGPLIKGMSRRLPREILTSPVFTSRLSEIMQGYTGVYALHARDRLYYIGLSTNLSGKVMHHTKDRHADKWDHFIAGLSAYCYEWFAAI